ncbi:hypothetical protein BC936DRAFT_148763 [Jimgerdemannia flammicorona]|uniref:Fungal-type protein kinase domain-containing protein n=1 Tax=Jimgerdemannia flammicorona TaxID=994334 RepID=A0A433D2C2_9FUNG|nr:hypothetical protein BC936DRAFT_148763 [Jimgerdemannia flammicorona]
MALTENLILFAVDHGLPMSNGAFHWRDVRIVGEFKSDAAFDTHRTDIQLAGYAREVFGAQPNRRFVQNAAMTIRPRWRHQLTNDRHPTIHKNIRPCHRWPQLHEQHGTLCNGKTEHFILLEVAFFCSVIRKAYQKDEPERTRRYYAIKDSWRPVMREAEGEQAAITAQKPNRVLQLTITTKTLRSIGRAMISWQTSPGTES